MNTHPPDPDLACPAPECERFLLVVDGHDDTRSMLRFCLEEAGLTVREASSGAEALRIIRESLPDAVAMEMWLPGEIDGYETCRLLREDERTRFLPILACTCLATPKDIERARQAAAIRCL